MRCARSLRPQETSPLVWRALLLYWRLTAATQPLRRLTAPRPPLTLLSLSFGLSRYLSADLLPAAAAQLQLLPALVAGSPACPLLGERVTGTSQRLRPPAMPNVRSDAT